MSFLVSIERKQWCGAHEPLFLDVRLELRAGERCAIAGPSGAGKSSLLHIAAGLDGDFLGAVSGRPEPLGIAFQTPRLLPWRTVRENLLLCARERGAFAVQLAIDLGLGHALDAYPSHISTGMAKRAALARALAVEPRLVALDEPFASLDDEAARRARDLVLDRLSGREATMLIVSHDLAADASLYDRVIHLGDAPASIVEDSRDAPVVHRLRAGFRRPGP